MPSNSASFGSWTTASPRAAVGLGGGAEERIDRGATARRGSTLEHAHPARFEREVVVGARHVDPSRCNLFAVDGLGRRQRPGAGDDLRQVAPRLRPRVEDHEHRRWQITGQGAEQAPEGFHAARGGADHDDVSAIHRGPGVPRQARLTASMSIQAMTTPSILWSTIR
jgi:hypothetical protein